MLFANNIVLVGENRVCINTFILTPNSWENKARNNNNINDDVLLSYFIYK